MQKLTSWQKKLPKAKEKEMSLSRKLLESMGLEADKVSTIIDAHVETVDSLKSQIEKYRTDAEALEATKKELTTARAELDSLKSTGGDWQKRYEEEHTAYEAYKSQQSAKELMSQKDKAYRDLLKEAKVDNKLIDLIMKGTDLEAIELENGKIKDADKVTESIKTEYSSYIEQTSVQGATTTTPPANTSLPKYSHDDIAKMSQAEINANWEAIKDSMKG